MLAVIAGILLVIVSMRMKNKLSKLTPNLLSELNEDEFSKVKKYFLQVHTAWTFFGLSIILIGLTDPIIAPIMFGPLIFGSIQELKMRKILKPFGFKPKHILKRIKENDAVKKKKKL